MTWPMTVAEFQALVTTSLSTAAIQQLLDAAEDAILAEVGPLTTDYESEGTVNEIITPRGKGSLLMLSRRADAAETISVTEITTDLAADDFELRSDGYILRRLNTGTNPASYWRGRVYVTYSPLSDSALRSIVQMELAKAYINFNPSLASQTIGSWSESYQQGDYAATRADILAQLARPAVGIW